MSSRSALIYRGSFRTTTEKPCLVGGERVGGFGGRTGKMAQRVKQTKRPKFNLWDPHGGKRESTVVEYNYIKVYYLCFCCFC